MAKRTTKADRAQIEQAQLARVLMGVSAGLLPIGAAMAVVGPKAAHAFLAAHEAEIASAVTGAESVALGAIQAAFIDDWRAAAWFLEHRYAHWNTKQQVDVAHSGRIEFVVVDEWRGGHGGDGSAGSNN